ncbi:AMP-binding protein [Zavarzinia compransoris]|uniref:AMP-binding protein n=1 Tax=Zavarzinia marina TaxID=2911065 RepID=UPI001F1B29E0|nr:AMP-binding protein [Zavarzinia marina]MCF4165298.1 AMP-binding protein [Zavarzinia marina]
MTRQPEAAAEADPKPAATAPARRSPIPRIFIALFAFCVTTAAIFVSLLLAGGEARGFGARGFLAAALLLVPAVVLPRLSGGIATRGRGQPMITWSMAVALLAAVVAAGAILARAEWALWLALALCGVVAALLGPLALSALHRLLPEAGRAAGVAAALAAVFLGAAGGVGLTHGVAALPAGGAPLMAALLIVVATTGWWLTRHLAGGRLGTLPPGDEVDLAALGTGGVTRTVEHMRRQDVPFTAAFAIAWVTAGLFFLLAFLPAAGRDLLGGGALVQYALLGVLGLGVALGARLALRLSHGAASAAWAPLAALVAIFAAFDLQAVAAALAAQAPAGADPRPLLALLADEGAIRFAIDVLFFGAAAGLWSTPLTVLIGDRTDERATAHHYAIAGLLVGLFGLVALLAGLGLSKAGLGLPGLFFLFALASVVLLVPAIRLWPDRLFKAATARLLRLLFRVEVKGAENIARAGARVVVVANHVSHLDAPLLAAFLPDATRFAATERVAQSLSARLLSKLIHLTPVDTSRPVAVKALIRGVEDGTPLVIFPEGRPTVTGGLMKVYEGPGMVADRAHAMVLPVRIEGPQYSLFSRLGGKLHRRLFPKVTIHVQEPERFEIPAHVHGRLRRQVAGNKLYDIMVEMMFHSGDLDTNLWQALLAARTNHGGATQVVEDQDRKPFSYNRLIMASLVLGKALSRKTAEGEICGVLLPNTAGVAVTFFALLAFGRVPAMLNFSAGPSTMASACQTARLKTVLTSRRFVAMAKLSEAIKAIEAVADVVYLEDIRESLGLGDKLWGVAASRFTGFFHGEAVAPANSPAVVLFTSGSEGLPKGVVLSHRNMNANQLQIASIVDITSQDKVLNPLPVFHSFGLLGGLVLPILQGVKTFLYPSPLHYRAIPELVYEIGATMMFGTDTFLNGYARAAHPYDFYSTRYIFAGAERVKDETRRTYGEKFGVRILEGYGTTECSPVVAVNTAMQFKPGSVGRLLPAIRSRLEPVEGIERGGRLVVSGPNVMLGYFRAEKPGVLEPCGDGWYDTGDIVDIDDLGFVTILGRAKRFAKVAGEMVSLAAVEHEASVLWPDFAHAVVNLPDPAKGERLAMMTTCPEADRSILSRHLHEHGLTELMLPKTIVQVEELPLLGSGKTDYQAVKSAFLKKAE